MILDFIQNHYKYERAENFVSASKHIREELEQLKQETLKKKMLKRTVENKQVDDDLVKQSQYNEGLNALIKIQKKIDKLVERAN